MKSSMPIAIQHSPAAERACWNASAVEDLPALDVPFSTTTFPGVTTEEIMPDELVSRSVIWNMATELLLITGAAGVGKSTACWEVSEELKRRNLPHAAVRAA